MKNPFNLNLLLSINVQEFSLDTSDVPLEKITFQKETSPGPDKEYDLKTRDALVEKAIESLKEMYKTVVLLKYYAGLSYEEIAETLEIPEKTVKSRLFDARMLLKDKLSKNLQYVD